MGSSLNVVDEIDYTIFGEDIQYVEIELGPGESAISEVGAMMYKNSHIIMDTVFCDGSGSKDDNGGIFDKLVGSGKRDFLVEKGSFLPSFVIRVKSGYNLYHSPDLQGA